MDFINIVKAVMEIGIIPVFCVLLFLMIWKTYQQMIKREETEILRHKELIEDLKLLKTNTSRSHSPEEEHNNRKINEFINYQLDLLLSELKANRVCCWLYHNGGYLIIGRSFQKMSIMFERVDGRTVAIMKEYQNVPRMLYPELIKIIDEVGYCDIEDVSKIETKYPTFYRALYERGTHAAFMSAIKSYTGGVLGFICAEYNINKVEDAKSAKECMSKKALRISGALDSNPDIVPITSDEEGGAK